MTVSENQKAAHKEYDKKYKYCTVKMRKDDKERLRKRKSELGHNSINDMILAALEQYTGLTGLRLKGDKTK